jgi:vacuolar-type H+-ATPase subunit D/Vma8
MLFYRAGGTTVTDVVKVLNDERKLLQKRLSSLEQAIEALGGEVAKDVKRAVKQGKKMSAATKRKLSLAAKARWAKIKKG